MFVVIQKLITIQIILQTYLITLEILLKFQIKCGKLFSFGISKIKLILRYIGIRNIILNLLVFWLDTFRLTFN